MQTAAQIIKLYSNRNWIHISLPHAVANIKSILKVINILTDIAHSLLSIDIARRNEVQFILLFIASFYLCSKASLGCNIKSIRNNTMIHTNTFLPLWELLKVLLSVILFLLYNNTWLTNRDWPHKSILLS